MPDDRLDDMGITRSEAKAAFHKRSSRRAGRGAPEKLVAFRLR